MSTLTAGNLVRFINNLDKKRWYNYINPSTKGFIQITGVDLPEGPVRIKRWDSNKGETPDQKREESISVEMIWRIANAFQPGIPVNFDRVLGGSYNTRSVFEALLAHTPQFYYCYPGRIEDKGNTTSIKPGHKHLIWQPDNPHDSGKIAKANTEIVISEIRQDVVYDALSSPVSLPERTGINIELQRRHAQMQFALYSIGHELGFRTWIAQNDKGIIYQNKKLGEYEGVIASLEKEKLISAHEEAVRAALLIDCIWFKNGRLMPAVMEIEHSTGVTSGLDRMRNFYNKSPRFHTRYVIVAPDEIRNKVIKEANKEHYTALDTRFFPYSAVEELYLLCKKRMIKKGITEEFLDCYMEKIVD